MERSLQTLMDTGLSNEGIEHQTKTYSKEPVTAQVTDVQHTDVEEIEKKVQSLTVSSSKKTKPNVVHIKNYNSSDQKASESLKQGELSVANTLDTATQICNFMKQYSLNITGTVTLPDGCIYERIYNVGGGDCFFISICQGLNFFGITMDHVQLRTNVAKWLQNPDHALLMELQLELLPADLYDHLKEYPPPPTGWENLLNGMTWQDWGAHIEVLGEWVGPMEITSTNHVLDAMGTDIRVNIYDPNSEQIFGDEENQLAGGIDKPIIMIMSWGGHFEWLRLKSE